MWLYSHPPTPLHAVARVQPDISPRWARSHREAGGGGRHGSDDVDGHGHGARRPAAVNRHECGGARLLCEDSVRNSIGLRFAPFVVVAAAEQWLFGESPHLNFLMANKARLTHGHPLFWSDERVASLEGSTVGNEVNRLRVAVREGHELLVASVPGFDEAVDFDLYRTLVALKLTRSFILGANADGDTDVAMLPFVDLLNHQNSPNTKFRYLKHDPSGSPSGGSGGGVFQFRATKTIREGEAWSVSYGTNHVKQSNANLLTTYGFSLPNNQMHDYVVVIDEEGARRTQVN